jgi:hypothetical protein
MRTIARALPPRPGRRNSAWTRLSYPDAARNLELNQRMLASSITLVVSEQHADLELDRIERLGANGLARGSTLHDGVAIA